MADRQIVIALVCQLAAMRGPVRGEKRSGTGSDWDGHPAAVRLVLSDLLSQ